MGKPRGKEKEEKKSMGNYFQWPSPESNRVVCLS
jgi:hypothetical protein